MFRLIKTILHDSGKCYLKHKNFPESALDSLDNSLQIPKDNFLGHFASTISFSLAKILKQNPKSIAVEFSDFLKKSKFSEIFSSIESLNAYINFRISIPFLKRLLDARLEQKKMECIIKELATQFKINLEYIKRKKKLIEYVSANPTGPLHIGHARGAIFGATLQRLGNYFGDTINTHYYINDAGNQINMLSISIFKSICDILNIHYECEEEFYSGEYIYDIAKLYLESKKWKKDNVLELFKNDKKIILNELGEFGKNLMLEEIKSNLNLLNIKIDTYVSEKEMFKDYEKTIKKLEENNALKIIEGTTWLRTSLMGDDKDRVLVRKNGEPTYIMGDLIYHIYKFEQDYDELINIWGADHHGYVARIKASMEFLNFDSKKLTVILTQMVSLLKAKKPYKMSKRAGNFILLSDVIENIKSDELIFTFLSKSIDTHLEFDVEDLKKEDASNPTFYINYANARIMSLFEKSDKNINNILSSDIIELQNCKDEKLIFDITNLLFDSLIFDHILEDAYKFNELHKICTNLRNIAKNLHYFYNNHKILNTQFELQILKILKFVSINLTNGFNLLGIQIKTKM